MLFTDLPYEKMQLAFLSLAIAIVARLSIRGDAGTGHMALAASIAGLMPLFKTNEGIGACVVFYALLASVAFSTTKTLRMVRHQFWILALLPLVVFMTGFIVVERNISGLWSYVTGSLQIAMGYSEAMAIPGPMSQALTAVFSLLALGFVIPLLAECRRDLVKGFLPALIAGFFAFKSGLVRQDDMHSDFLQIKLAVAGVFLLICTRNVRDRRLLVTYVIASFCFGAILYQQAFPNQSQTLKRRVLLQDVWPNVSASWYLSSTWEQVHERVRSQLDNLRLDTTVSNLVDSGTADDVPFELDIVEANGWRWKPRPVFQSYSAYTPALDQLNAHHLASRESADHIIMQWGDIDGRQALLDDAASWRALFDHYDVQLTRPELLVLKRRDSSRYFEPQPLGKLTGTWKRAVAVPDAVPNSITMMRAEIGKSLYGVLRGVLFRNSDTYLSAISVSGKASRWRVTRANLADGAFITLLPQNLSEVLPYFGQSAEGAPERVATIQFETANPVEFSSAIRISWYSVAFRPGGGSLPEQPTVEPVPAKGPLTRLLKMETRGFIDDVNGQPLSTGPVQASSSRPVVLTGWVVDLAAHKAAAAVYVDVDGELFPTSYGSSRPDVVNALKEPGYEKSGFRGVIPAVPGSHKVMLRVVNAAGTGYYAGPSITLNIAPYR